MFQQQDSVTFLAGRKGAGGTLDAAERIAHLVGELGGELPAAELARLRPRLRAHRYEWTSLQLMARVMALHRRARHALLEVEFFHANHRQGCCKEENAGICHQYFQSGPHQYSPPIP